MACPRRPDLHHEELPDIVAQRLQQMSERIEALEAQIQEFGAQSEQDAGIEEEMPTWA